MTPCTALSNHRPEDLSCTSATALTPNHANSLHLLKTLYCHCLHAKRNLIATFCFQNVPFQNNNEPSATLDTSCLFEHFDHDLCERKQTDTTKRVFIICVLVLLSISRGGYNRPHVDFTLFIPCMAIQCVAGGRRCSNMEHILPPAGLLK